jgi:hypothetical protein
MDDILCRRARVRQHEKLRETGSAQQEAGSGKQEAP